MAREINWDAPLSEDDLKWLEQRMTPVLADKVAANKAKFAEEDAKDAEDDDDDTKVDDDYDSWKLGELKAEAEAREGLDMTGLKNKPDLIAALRTWDAANPES